MTSLDTDDAFFQGVIIQSDVSPAGVSSWKWRLRPFDAWKITKPGVQRLFDGRLTPGYFVRGYEGCSKRIAYFYLETSNFNLAQKCSFHAIKELPVARNAKLQPM